MQFGGTQAFGQAFADDGEEYEPEERERIM
jgi:hypothetical protein